MKRHPKLIPLSREHHELLLLAQLCKKDAPPYRGMPEDYEGKLAFLLGKQIDSLSSHLKKEEKDLFPILQKLSAQGREYADTLLEQHKKIEEKIAELKRYPSMDLLDAFGYMLEYHIRCEERIAFVYLQEHAHEDEFQKLNFE
ncbi:MAG: hemerythrin domain-containing protein [Cyclobacteriaceae bacterium]|nr:hemerythrin domain-containing protein [Cyclobacteriaceae bacterium]MCH8517219.1 hemerythrin domain-containing protein [Cyclobacteriaceae bacterium]